MSHKCGFSAQYLEIVSAITLLNRSTCPFLWEWYGVVLVLSIINRRQISCIKSLLKLVPWSVCNTSGAPYLSIHSSTIALATVAAVISFNGRVTTYFVYKSEITRTYFALDFEAKVTGPKMSAAITLNELKSWVDCNSALRFFPAVERAVQRSQFAICRSTLDLMKGHQNLCLILAKVFCTAKWPPLVGASCKWYKISWRIDFGTTACHTSFTRLLGFHLLNNTPLDMANSSQFVHNSTASGFPHVKASSLEIGFSPNDSLVPFRLTISLFKLFRKHLMPGSNFCCLANALSDLVHEIRTVTLSAASISSGVTVAQKSAALPSCLWAMLTFGSC